MKLGFYYHIPAIEINGNIFMPGYLGLFIDSLAIHFKSIVTFQHLPDAGENTIFDYQIRSKNVLLVSLAPRGSVPHRMLHMREFTRKIKKHEDEFDAILLRGPTPLLPPIANKLNKPSTLQPCCLSKRADTEESTPPERPTMISGAELFMLK